MKRLPCLAIWMLGAGLATAQPVWEDTAAGDAYGAGAAAQPGAPAATRAAARERRRWTVSIVTGVPSSAPLRDIEDAMRATGFNGSSGGCIFDLCFSPSSTPYSMHARAYRDTWSAMVNRRLGRRVGVGITTGRALLGWTDGRHKASGAFLEVETAVRHVVPMATMTPFAGLRLGAGAGLFTTTFARTGVERVALSTSRGPGVLGELSLTFPRRMRVFAELSAQQRWLGRQPLGPIDVLPAGAAVFPRTDVRVSHWFIGLGAGVRF